MALVPLFKQRCDDCTWGLITLGECHFEAPRWGLVAEDWPSVSPDTRCSNYFPKHTPEGAPLCRTCLYYQPDGPDGHYCVFLPPGHTVEKMPRTHETRRCHEWRPNYTIMIEEV